jgi:hypothetical protein
VDLLAFGERQGWAAHNICSFPPRHPGRRTFLRWPSRPLNPMAFASNLTIESTHLAGDHSRLVA